MRTTPVVAALLASACAKTPATDHTTDNSTDPCIKLLDNGGFENGLAHWNVTGDVSVQTTGCFEGEKCALISGGGKISQSAMIPTGGVTSLDLQILMTCPDPTAGGQLGRLLDQSGALILTLFGPCDGATGFVQVLVDLTDRGGQSVTLELSVAAGASTLVVDAVKLQNHADEGPVNGCGVGKCDGNPECEECLQDGECAEGPDPIWSGTGCVCPLFTPETCNLPFCCEQGAHWDPKACELGILDCMKDGFANTCGVGACNGDAACDACLAGAACDSGVQPVWTGSACACPDAAAQPPKNCFLPFCCADGTHWDTSKCACAPGPVN
jgi:hypothetical protein